MDSAGAFLPLQSEIFPSKDHGGRVFYNEAVLSADGIPQVNINSSLEKILLWKTQTYICLEIRIIEFIKCSQSL